MSVEGLRGEALCRAIMWDIHDTIDQISSRMAGYLRRGARCAADEYMGRNVLKLAPASLTQEQVDALEESLRQAQEELVDALFCIIDGGTQPEGFPSAIRLVDMDSGEPICPEFLASAFSMVGLDWREHKRAQRRAVKDE